MGHIKSRKKVLVTREKGLLYAQWVTKQREIKTIWIYLKGTQCIVLKNIPFSLFVSPIHSNHIKQLAIVTHSHYNTHAMTMVIMYKEPTPKFVTPNLEQNLTN